jgi:predicted AlkP superfamily pyrophosphatase or phosphodiesterase
MIANVIRDPKTGRLFERTNRTEIEDPMWWGGDPIWNLAQRRGIFAATMFWPGSEAPVGGMRPRFWREYDDLLPGDARVDQVLAWLDVADSERPGLVTLYLNEIDTLGHWYGPDSPQVREAIVRTDAQLGRLLDGLRRRGLAGSTNLVVVSDHGMAPTTRDRTIVVDDLVALGDVEIADINPTLGITPAPGAEARVAAALGAHPRLRMYRREETPPHWRFRENPRIPPLTGVADEGWVVLRRGQVDDYWKRSDNGGQHGYDPQVPSMRGLFIANGPAFKQATIVPAFENVHVYNLLALVLGLPARPNDGDPAIARSILR